MNSELFFILIILAILVSLPLYYNWKIGKIKEKMEEDSKLKFEQWLNIYSQEIQKNIENSTKEKYEGLFMQWKTDEEKRIRKDALKRSVNTILGSISEELSPLILTQELNVNPKDFRHLGTPVDYVAFKGLSDGKVSEIIFIEIKSSKTLNMTDREKSVRQAVEDKRVTYVLKDLSGLMENAKNKLDMNFRE